MKAAETHRRKLLTDRMSSPHSLHGHFTGGRKRKSRASGASYQWRLAPQKEWRHPKVYKGVRSPALAEACDSTPCCRHNSDVTHDNTLLKKTSSFPLRHSEFPQLTEETQTHLDRLLWAGTTGGFHRPRDWALDWVSMGAFHRASLWTQHRPGVYTAAAQEKV